MGHLLPAAAAQLRLDPRIRSERPAFDLHHPEAAPASLRPSADVLSRIVGTADLGEGLHPHHTGDLDHDKHPRYHEERDR